MISVCELGAIPSGEAVRVDGPTPIAVFNADGELYAIDDTCTHQDASLADGWLEGCVVECPLQASCFDLRTGQVSGPAAKRPVRTYRVVAQYYVGYGAKFGDEIEAFTVDGSEGFGQIGGLGEEHDRRYYAVTVQPQVFINLVPDHVIFHRMYPVAADRTIVECDWLYSPAVVVRGRDLSRSVELFHRVNEQDFDACERCQPTCRHGTTRTVACSCRTAPHRRLPQMGYRHARRHHGAAAIPELPGDAGRCRSSSARG